MLQKSCQSYLEEESLDDITHCHFKSLLIFAANVIFQTTGFYPFVSKAIILMI